MASRKCEDWISSFIDSCEHTVSPAPYIKWAAIATVAGVLGRNVWTYTYGSELYPNMYTILVGPPGVGKTEMTDRVRVLWRSVPNRFVASSNLTRASLADELSEAIIINKSGECNSLLLSSNELGVLIPQYDTEFMSALTDIYDCKVYTERRRTRSLHIDIPRPQINMIAGCTVNYLQTMLPESAWEQGFCSRLILVYSGEQKIQSLFMDKGDISIKRLKQDLIQMSKIQGKFVFTKDAAAFIDQWHIAKGPPRPTHPKLMAYCSRRSAHLLKLSMIASIVESNELIITKPHIQRALDWLMEAEANMEDIFKTMAGGGDSSVMKDTYHFAYQFYVRKEQPIPRTLVVAFLGERADAYKVERILEVMEAKGALQPINEKGVACYKPKVVRND